MRITGLIPGMRDKNCFNRRLHGPNHFFFQFFVMMTCRFGSTTAQSYLRLRTLSNSNSPKILFTLLLALSLRYLVVPASFSSCRCASCSHSCANSKKCPRKDAKNLFSPFSSLPAYIPLIDSALKLSKSRINP